jgi:RNase P subunit RPR2
MALPETPAVAVPAEADASAYCVKCKSTRKMVNAEVTTVKNGKNALKGKCEVCGTTMMKFLGGKKKDAGAAPAA